MKHPKKTKKLLAKLKETGMPEFKGPKIPGADDKSKKEDEEEDEEQEY